MKVKNLVFISVLLIFAACSKEESFLDTHNGSAFTNPDGSPKLHKVIDENGTVEYTYNEDGTLAEELFHETENTDKQTTFKSKYIYENAIIKRIDYYWEQDLQFSEYFEYDDEYNLTRSFLENSQWGYSLFFYNSNNLLSRVEEYYSSSFIDKHNNYLFNKIHKFTDWHHKAESPVLNFITFIEYSDDKKLKQINYFEAGGVKDEPTLIYSKEFQFDNNKSPFYYLGFPYFSSSYISKNNVKTIVQTNFDQQDTVVTLLDIKYQYNSYNYPTQAIISKDEIYSESTGFEYFGD